MTMQPYDLNIATRSTAPPSNGMPIDMQEAARAAERARLRQGIMHVRIRHFYCTLEEMFDPSLRGQCFVVGTGTGRPNEPGRVIDASPAAERLGVSPGMPLRRAHRLAPRTRFLPASYDRYQPILQPLRERYRAYSRIIESIPIADTFIDLRGCELPFDSPVALARGGRQERASGFGGRGRVGCSSTRFWHHDVCTGRDVDGRRADTPFRPAWWLALSSGLWSGCQPRRARCPAAEPECACPFSSRCRCR